MNPNDPTTTFTGLPNTTYTLIWTISTECGSSVDQVEISFVTPPWCGIPFTDARDGNTYNTIQIGSLCVMAENLAYLPSVSPPSSLSTIIPLYYVYGFLGSNVESAKATSNYQTYGVLYNYSAASAGEASSNSVPSGVQGACPEGWHLPSDSEWNILEGSVDTQYGIGDPIWNNYQGRGFDAGGNLKGDRHYTLEFTKYRCYKY